MLASTFDDVARRLAGRHSRRAALTGAATAAALAAVPKIASAQATPATTDMQPEPHSFANRDETAFLFVQSFGSGTWVPNPDDDDTYTLTLSSVGPTTIYFSDRPERIFGMWQTRAFLEGLGFTAANPPNAALMVDHPETGEQEILVIELIDPVYDESNATLTYRARVLAEYGGDGLRHAATNQADFTLPDRFGQGGLFIDDCPDAYGSCYDLDGRFVGTVNVGQCSDDVFVCNPCHPAEAYCAGAFPECVYRFYDSAGNLTGVAHTCTWSPGDPGSMPLG